MRSEAAAALRGLYDAAVAAGEPFRVSTAYRSYHTQTWIYQGHVNEQGRAAADTFSARPGFSEHQTGLAVDVYTTEECRLRTCFGNTDTGTWIAQHAAAHGFIVRYPRDAQQITGYAYEPWHLRYVGRELALEMERTGVRTLEEFFTLSAAPDYAS